MIEQATACAWPATRCRKGGSERLRRHGGQPMSRSRAIRSSRRFALADQCTGRPSTSITSAARARRVVVAGHGHRIGAGRQHRQHVAGLHRQLAVAAQPVARFADRADHVPGASGAASRCWQGSMAIQAWYMAGRIRSFMAASTMQKFFACARLQVQHLGQQHAGIADQRAARLQQQLAVAVAARVDALQQRAHQFVGAGGARRCSVMPRPPPTSMWWMAMPCGLHRLHQVEQAVQRVEVGLHLRDLRADVAIDAHHLQARQRRGAAVAGQRLVVGDAELVVLQAGGDVGVGAGVDVGIDAQADPRRAAHGQRLLRQQLQLALAFDVEAAHAGLQARGASRRGSCRRPRTPPSTASPPAASTRSSSPAETMSKPQPACAKVCSTARLGLAFIA